MIYEIMQDSKILLNLRFEWIKTCVPIACKSETLMRGLNRFPEFIRLKVLFTMVV